MIMDFHDEEEVVAQGKESGFLDDSSVVEMFNPGSGNQVEMSDELRSIENEDAVNSQLDKCIMLDDSDDQADAGNGLEAMLDDFMRDQEDKLDDEDDMRKVHRFTRPILSEEDLDAYKPRLAEIGEDVKIVGKEKGKASSPENASVKGNSKSTQNSSSIPQESRRQDRQLELEVEGVEAVSTGWRCGVCMNGNNQSLMQTFCSVF